MPELVYFLVIVLISGVLLRFVYLMGRDAAEQESYATISTLRAEIRRQHLREQRLTERLRTRTGRYSAEMEFDLWMQ